MHFVQLVDDISIDIRSPLCRWEFKKNHEDWLITAKPDLSPPIAERVITALETSPQLVPLAQKIRDEACLAINELLKVNFSVSA